MWVVSTSQSSVRHHQISIAEDILWVKVLLDSSEKPDTWGRDGPLKKLFSDLSNCTNNTQPLHVTSVSTDRPLTWKLVTWGWVASHPHQLGRLWSTSSVTWVRVKFMAWLGSGLNSWLDFGPGQSHGLTWVRVKAMAWLGSGSKSWLDMGPGQSHGLTLVQVKVTAWLGSGSKPINQSPELTMAPNSQSSEAPTYNVMNIVSEKTIQWTTGP